MIWIPIIIGSYFLGMTFFVAIMKAQDMREAERLNRFWRFTLFPAALLGIIFDVVF